MRSKTYNEVKKKAPADPVDIKAAISFLKENSRKSFDETVELHVKLGVNAAKSDQMVRGSVSFPHGTPKKKRIAVFTNDSAMQKKAEKAGAAIVGGDNLIEEIGASGSLDADVAVATPDMMPKVARVAKILGPKGLMPNPKTGTVAPDAAAVVEQLSAGQVSFKMDQQGNIHEAVAKASWDDEKIAGNIEAMVEAVRASRPVAQKGEYLRSVTVSTTMSPGIRVAV